MMNYELISYLKTHSVAYETNVDLRNKTWIHRGGIAGLFISPSCAEELERVVLYLYINNIQFLLIGHTSNLYILNDCNKSVVVSTAKCRNYSLEGDRIYCESGVGVIRLAKQMVKEGVQGFEYLTGLPGTIGGALVNNSSCKNNSVSSLLISAKVVLKEGTTKTFYPDDFKFEFRNSVFKMGEIEGTIISAVLSVQKGDAAELQQIAKQNDKDRAKRLEGHANNLGCTVNRCFINGRMSIWLRVLMILNRLFVSPFIKTEEAKRIQRRDLICSVTGYKQIAPYVSSKNPIIFSWHNEGADVAFPLYLDFMRKVYKTDKIEIQIIKE